MIKQDSRTVLISIAGYIALTLLLSLFSGCVDSNEKEKTLKVALTGKYPPFSMYDKSGNLDGFDVDVSKKIAEHLGLELELTTTEWDGILAGLLAKKYDAIIGSMAVTPEREKKVNFSLPYYESGAHLFVHEKYKDEIRDINDCSDKSLGVVLGETFEHYLRENHPEINVVTYKSTVDIFQDIQNDKLVGFVSDKLLGAYQIKMGNKPFIPAGDLLYKEQMAIPVLKDNPELLKKINDALEKMKTNGELDTLFNKWFGLVIDDSK